MKTLPSYYEQFISVKAVSTHTDKLHQITVLSVKKHFESWYNKKTNKGGKKNFTYVYYKTNDGTFYPAANHGYLDGLVGCIKLAEFNRKYKPVIVATLS